jgi:hypothetical protein
MKKGLHLNLITQQPKYGSLVAKGWGDILGFKLGETIEEV